MSDVIAVIPAFNEAARIASTVRALRSTGRFAEIVVVDDASTDDTTEEAMREGARVVRLPTNKGKGAAVATGIAATSAPVLLLCDADLESSAAALVALLDPIVENRADMTIAAPPAEGGPSGFGLVEAFARLGVKILSGTNTDRPLSGQRAVRRSALPDEFADGFGFEVGLTIDVARTGARVLEIPVSFTHASTGRDLAGFIHRGKQGAHIAGALLSRVKGRR